MSERKVLSKYYPPDFDPSAITRRRSKPKQAGPAVQVVRLMAPVSMRCTRCGEYIYKGRKFNARKETPDERYLGIQIFRFYIRCTRCSAEIIFRTDPKNQDYVIISGAKRNIEPWHQANNETDAQRLDRLAAEEAAAAGADGADGTLAEQNRMEELEAKTLEARREMDVADALDEIRTRNARLARADHRDHLEAVALTALPADEEERRRQQDLEDEEAVRKAFAWRHAAEDAAVDGVADATAAPGSAMATIVEEGSCSRSDGNESVDNDGDDKPAWLSSGTSVSSSKQSAEGTAQPAQSQPQQPAPAPAPAPAQPAAVPAAQAPSFKRQVKKKKDRAALLGIKKKPSLV